MLIRGIPTPMCRWADVRGAAPGMCHDPVALSSRLRSRFVLVPPLLLVAIVWILGRAWAQLILDLPLTDLDRTFEGLQR